HEPVATTPTIADLESGGAEVRRMPVWQSTLVALGSLVILLGVALAVMIGVGAILHAVNPARNFDVFYVFHNGIVVACLIGVSLLWLLPPHPWAKKLVEATYREEPAVAAGGAESGEDALAVLAMEGNREPPPRQGTSEEVGEEMAHL
ncbi:MAG: hypothetical protein ACRDWE_09530, partial [Acidimicrobiales bacterium]